MKANWEKVPYFLVTFDQLVCIGSVWANISMANHFVSAVSANRSLPKTYMPDEQVKVTLGPDILADKAPNGVIVKENLPAGWKILSA